MMLRRILKRVNNRRAFYRGLYIIGFEVIMSDNLINIDVPPNEWIDIYDYLLSQGINRNDVIVVFNSGASDIKLSTSISKPEEDTQNYQILRKFGLPMKNDGGSFHEWAYSQNVKGRISVRAL